MKKIYEKPISVALDNPFLTEGTRPLNCSSGSTATTYGLTDCRDGGSTNGGICHNGGNVTGCTSGHRVNNYCVDGGSGLSQPSSPGALKSLHK